MQPIHQDTNLMTTRPYTVSYNKSYKLLISWSQLTCDSAAGRLVYICLEHFTAGCCHLFPILYFTGREFLRYSVVSVLKSQLNNTSEIIWVNWYKFTFSDGGAGQRNERRRDWGACKKSKVISHFDPFCFCRYVYL